MGIGQENSHRNLAAVMSNAYEHRSKFHRQRTHQERKECNMSHQTSRLQFRNRAALPLDYEWSLFRSVRRA